MIKAYFYHEYNDPIHQYAQSNKTWYASSVYRLNRFDHQQILYSDVSLQSFCQI
jgi:hypothetical protein